MLHRLTLAVLLAWLPLAQAALPETVAAKLAAANISEDAVGVLVLRGDQVLLAHNETRPLQPASTMKVITTVTALDMLGPIFRGRTEILTTGVLEGDVLHGDLYLRGGADPDFDPAALDIMLQSLRNQGIRKIDGRLMIDRQLWQPARYDQGPPFDEEPNAYYNVIPDALLFNRNMIDIDMRSTNRLVKLSLWPQLEGVSVASEMTLTDANCASWEAGWQPPVVKERIAGRHTITLRGTFPRNCNQHNWVNVLDRNDYLAHAVRGAWRRLGGVFMHETAEGKTPPEARLLAAHRARALPEIVRDTNKDSDNLFARTLYLSLGSLQSDPVLGSKPLPESAETTPSHAERRLREWFIAHAIDDTGLVLENGSGLSRSERVTVSQLAGVLKVAQHFKWAPEFQSSLPIAGVDGTMKRRLIDSPAAEHARIKTGTLRNTVGVAGYVPDANGQPLIVAAIVNDEKVGGGVGRGVLDALIDWASRQR